MRWRCILKYWDKIEPSRDALRKHKIHSINRDDSIHCLNYLRSVDEYLFHAAKLLSQNPANSPTPAPTLAPTLAPTAAPTAAPTSAPTPAQSDGIRSMTRTVLHNFLEVFGDLARVPKFVQHGYRDYHTLLLQVLETLNTNARIFVPLSPEPTLPLWDDLKESLLVHLRRRLEHRNWILPESSRAVIISASSRVDTSPQTQRDGSTSLQSALDKFISLYKRYVRPFVLAACHLTRNGLHYRP